MVSGTYVSIPDFIAIGHLCCDILDGSCMLGGSASYASLTAHRLGRRVGVVTAAGDNFPFMEAFKGIMLKNVGSPSTVRLQTLWDSLLSELGYRIGFLSQVDGLASC